MIDLHTHSRFSDGTDTIPELLGAAVRAGLEALALTDHDTMDGVDQAQAVGRDLGVEVLRGAEISTHLLVGSVEYPVHLLGYGCRDDDDDLAALLDEIREARRTRLPRMLDLLAELGMPLQLSDVEACSDQASSTGRPHVADALVAKGYVSNRDEAFAQFLGETGPAYVPRYTPDIAEALDTVNRAGGVGVIAHPWIQDHVTVMTARTVAALATGHGLFGLEADHPDHPPQTRMALHTLADDLGLVVTGSSDYHGAGKQCNLLGACQTPRRVYQAIRQEIEQRGGQA
ncbi:MAG: PHP domain-containing protein [Propionibacteriaceae bacterium]|nr:PHP domain-containing protein [Propionibacteriaceae bacterium]